MEINSYSTWLEIDLNAIHDNTASIKEMTGTAVMAVIKANAYGHGARPCAQAAIAGGATWLGVARTEEALALRRAGISTRILVLGYTPPAKIPEAIEQNISVSLIDPELTQQYIEYARMNGGTLHGHVKVETGMGRLGMEPEEVKPFLESLQGSSIQAEGIFTHFARADEPENPATLKQIALFEEMLEALKAAGICPEIVHAANSAAIFNFPQSWYNLVRPGDILYGMAPSAGMELGDGFRQALSWKTRIIQLHDYPAGQGISYGSIYTTRKNEKIGVIPIGYGDGFRRVNHQQVLVGGKRVNVVGRVCMDQCMIQLDRVKGVKVGDEVVLIGNQGNKSITVDEVAKRWNTINYEVSCGLAERLPRIYIQ
ncbi:MAG: alanine racemase [Anaerolineaceae bacterium]|nr:alanine racemase [Anaerolineaceae bacterium]